MNAPVAADILSTPMPAPALPCATDEPEPPPLMGLARLMTRAFRGEDLKPLAQALIDRASRDERDANALMDLSTVLHLQGLHEVALATQAHALALQRVYTLPSAKPSRIHLLALMTAGDLMMNAPLPFLIEDSDVTLSMLYIGPGEALPDPLPEHDVACVAISEASTTQYLLSELATVTPHWPRPVINPPDAILNTSRTSAYAVLGSAPGLDMPMTAWVTRSELNALGNGQIPLRTLLADGQFPLIARPLDSHAGHGLERLDSALDVQRYLHDNPGDDFYLSRFVDYSGPDGLFRKYRVVLIDGQPFAAHMGVSSHWMIHYLNAGMSEQAAKRAEEERFMRDFDTDFAVRHQDALSTVAKRFGLDYLVVDCAETPDGRLLVFEVDPGAVVHRMDPVDLFPYKPHSMQRVFSAYRALLERKTQRPV